MTIDLSLKNLSLYEGCEIEEVAGRLNLVTPPAEAVNIVGRNIARIVQDTTDRESVTLTGAMAVWAYLVVFHAVVHAFGSVYYDDGRNLPVLIGSTDKMNGAVIKNKWGELTFSPEVTRDRVTFYKILNSPLDLAEGDRYAYEVVKVIPTHKTDKGGKPMFVAEVKLIRLLYEDSKAFDF